MGDYNLRSFCIKINRGEGGRNDKIDKFSSKEYKYKLFIIITVQSFTHHHANFIHKISKILDDGLSFISSYTFKHGYCQAR